MITNDKIGSATVFQHEDTVLKTAAQFFAEELIPYLGIDGKVVSSAPTESIVLNLKKFYEDINLIMEDGTWKHFEFQSKNEGIPGLKRFRSYEAVTSISMAFLSPHTFFIREISEIRSLHLLKE